MKNYNMVMKDPLVSMAKKSLANLPTPLSISFLWNMGFLLGMTMIMQVITGVLLSMNYVAHTSMAFESVMHMMRDIQWGWVVRYTHMNGASVLFFLMFIHIARGLYFNSTVKLPMVWISGVVILLMSMMAAFMGYVLPWGQMSYWGATVITSMLSSVPYIGKELIMWLWGDFSVSQPTLNRMFSLHFLVPLVILALAMIHLIFLHQNGSSNPSMSNPNLDKMKFFPFFMVKDMSPMMVIMIMMSLLMSVSPEILGDPENFNTASMTTTPTHIKPEWYFLFAYSILRSIPSKLGGVVAMAMAILILMVTSVKKNKPSKKFNPKKKMVFWGWTTVFLLLTWTGGKPVSSISSLISEVMTMFYFSMAMMI